MSEQKHLILFLGDGSNNLHLMAESFARSMNKDGVGLPSKKLATIFERYWSLCFHLCELIDSWISFPREPSILKHARFTPPVVWMRT